MHAYWPAGNTRPHFHLTKGYIGTDSYNLIGKTKDQIDNMWKGTRDIAINKNNWDQMDPIIRKLLDS